MILNHLVSFWLFFFSNASQKWTGARNLSSPFNGIFFKFSYGNRITKLLVSFFKNTAFPLLFTENNSMMSRVMQMLFGAQFAD